MLHFPGAFRLSVTAVSTTEATLSWDPRDVETFTALSAPSPPNGRGGKAPERAVLVDGKAWPHTTWRNGSSPQGRGKGEETRSMVNFARLNPGTNYSVILQIGSFQSVGVSIRTMQPDTPPSVPISSSLAGPVRSGRQAPKMRSAGVQTEGSDEEVMSALLDPTGKKVDRVKERVLTSIRDIETLELALEREKTEGIRELAQLQTEVEGLREASQKVDNRSARRTEDRITALHGQVKALTTRRQVQEREMRRLREERLRLERKEAELRAQVERLKAQAKAKEAAETERRARVKAVRQREADRIEEEREEAEKRLEALSHEVSVLAKALDEGKFQEKIVELEDRRSKAYERRDEIQRERAELSASIQPRTEEEMAEAIRLLERRVDEKRRFAEGEIAFVERLWEEVQKADGGLMDGERPMDDEKSMEGEESMEDGGKDEAR